MKKDTLQKKRRPVQSKKGLMLLHSKTRRKKHRVSASAAADLGSEVPNLGVARALFIILLLHVAAIAAIIVHNRMTSDEPVVRKEEAAKPASPVGTAAAVATPLPQVQQGEDYYFVATGDTYERVAQIKGVDVNALRSLNENVSLKAGRILRIPTAGTTTLSAAPEDYDVSRPKEPKNKQRMTMAETVSVSTQDVAISEPEVHSPAPRAVIVEETPAPVEPAVVVRPQVEAPQTEAAPSGQKYTVKSGDTVWSISRRFQVSRDDLLQLNGVNDPRKLKIGMTLVIPGN